LQAILKFGTDKFKELMIDVVMESDPKEVVRKTINMPLLIDKSDYNFWRLQFKLKWELEINGDEKMEPLRMALTNAFKKLDYDAPETEAQLMLIFIDGIGSSMLKGSSIDPSEIIELLSKKHNL
jgi:hypothetical protein